MTRMTSCSSATSSSPPPTPSPVIRNVGGRVTQAVIDDIAFLAGQLFGGQAGGSPGLIDWTIQMIVDTPPCCWKRSRSSPTLTCGPSFRKSSSPPMIVHGDQDASAPIELTGRKTAELIPAGSLILYPGAGHGLYANGHDTLNADLLAFINGHHPKPGLPHHAPT